MRDLNASPKSPQDKILGIAYCEFDNLEGPKISYQKPVDLISKSTFDSISNYIISKPELKNRIITITIDDYRICGYPIHIDNSKYSRNKFIYNTCFIFNKNTNTCSYEAVVKKLACDFKILETECDFLSKEETKSHLPLLLEQIRTSLNQNGECVIQKIGNLEHSSLFLKLIQKHVDPQNVQSFEVPVFTTNIGNFQVDEWDLTTNMIINSINGFKTVAKIAVDTKIEQNVVKENVQNLIYSNVVTLVPVIQYSSMFVTTPKLTELYVRKSTHQDAVLFIALDPHKEYPAFNDIFELYSSFIHGITVKDINERHCPREKNIDLKKQILYGLLKGYLRKINKYPIKISDMKTSNQSLNTLPASKYNGNNNYDKLCSDMSLKELDEQIDKDPNIIVYIK